MGLSKSLTIGSLFVSFFFGSYVYADDVTVAPGSVQTVQEADGSPVCNAPILEVSNGTLTDNSSTGKCTITNTGGGGGTPGGLDTQVQYNNASSFGGITNFTTNGTNITAATFAANILVNGSTSGTITLARPAVAGTNTLTFPAETGTFCSTSSVCSGYAASATTLTGGAGIAAIGDLSTNRTIATASGEADFIASGALTCGAATQGKVQVHTTPLQYCDNAATPALQYAAYGNSTGVATSATALAANGANCSAGNYPLGVDASGAAESCTAAATGTVTSVATSSGVTGGTITTTGTISLDYTATLAGNPAMNAGECRMATTGIICEGATADTIETLLTLTDPTASDKTITFPNATGTVAVSATSPVTLSALGDIGIGADTVTATQIDETANYTFTGSLIADGANPTVNAAGKIGRDSTDTQLLVGATPDVYPATYRECHTYENLVAADDNVLFMVARNDLTATASHCRTSGFTTQPTITWEDDSANAMTGSPTCNATVTQVATAITAGGSVTQNEAVRFDTTNTPAPTFGTEVTLCIDYTWVRK